MKVMLRKKQNGDEEIYGGEISVWNRSWAKEINHILCSCSFRVYVRKIFVKIFTYRIGFKNLATNENIQILFSYYIDDS